MIRVISDFGLWELIEDAKRYKMILYVDAAYEKPVRNLLRCVDVEIAYCITAGRDTDSVYDLLYENQDQIMVVVVCEAFYAARVKLEGLGLRLGVNFKNIQNYMRGANAVPYHYDPVLGYNLDTADEETKGFAVFGDSKRADNIRILTLGGSTTDAYTLPFRSWSEYLHEILEERNIANVVFCGGVAAYTSSGELFKLIRDGFALEPDMVLNYSGINDVGLPRYPYINRYMRQMCGYLESQNAVKGVNFDQHTFGLSWGVNGSFDATVQSDYNFWINNQKMIHAVCQARKVEQITFYQPSLFNGRKKMSETEQSYQLNLVYTGGDRIPGNVYADRVKAFDSLVMKDIDKSDWMYDLSGIFTEEDVYFDLCHVYEFGNRIIAERIADLVSAHLTGKVGKNK